MQSNQHSNGQKKGVVQNIMFFATTFVVFGTTLFILSSFDLLPNAPGESEPVSTSGNRTLAPASGNQVLPTKIEIPKLALTTMVANPTSTNADVLDQNLLVGAVRYPSSGTLGVVGTNVVVFGHSSYLPVVHNQAYKTFDGIQTLVKGDQILVTGAGIIYVYEVETVATANVATDGIPLTVEGNKLTLVTCDSFKTKSDRYVVVSHLVGSYPSTK